MKTSEDLKYLGETLFGITLPEDSTEARETFTKLFQKTQLLTFKGVDLIQMLEEWGSAALEGETLTYGVSHIRFEGRQYNVSTPRAYPRLVALAFFKEASIQDVIEVLVSCEIPAP